MPGTINPSLKSSIDKVIEEVRRMNANPCHYRLRMEYRGKSDWRYITDASPCSIQAALAEFAAANGASSPADIGYVISKLDPGAPRPWLSAGI